MTFVDKSISSELDLNQFRKKCFSIFCSFFKESLFSLLLIITKSKLELGEFSIIISKSVKLNVPKVFLPLFNLALRKFFLVSINLY